MAYLDSMIDPVLSELFRICAAYPYLDVCFSYGSEMDL